MTLSSWYLRGLGDVTVLLAAVKRESCNGKIEFKPETVNKETKIQEENTYINRGRLGTFFLFKNRVRCGNCINNTTYQRYMPSSGSSSRKNKRDKHQCSLFFYPDAPNGMSAVVYKRDKGGGGGGKNPTTSD